MDERLFLKSIRLSLAEWPALQLAISNGMGGDAAREKEHWMAETIEEFFQKNSDIYPDEVADFVSEILNNEFDTLVEEPSLDLLAANLCHYFALHNHGESEKLVEILTRRSRTHDVNQMSNLLTQVDTMQIENEDEDIDSCSSDGDNEEDDEQADLASECIGQVTTNGEHSSGPPSQSRAQPRYSEPDEEGWVTVNNKNKRPHNK